MRIIIFGGGGFLGKKLTLSLLNQGQLSLNGEVPVAISKLVLFDKIMPSGFPNDPRLELIEGDICEEGTIRSLLEQPTDVIFHLAAIVSGEAEKNFDLGMQVNLYASMQLLELCRELNIQPVIVFASSCAVFGGELTDTIYDDTAARPQSSYGTQKAITEMLINDYSRRGFVDGRILRLPTIVVRPGKPNAATSSFASSIIREPLQGERATCPVSADTKIWILSPRRVTENFIHAAVLEASTLGTDRIVTLPGLTTSVKEIVDNLEDIAGKETTALIDFQPDPFIQSIVLTWPPQFLPKRATELGFKRDGSIREVIEAFMEEELE